MKDFRTHMEDWMCQYKVETLKIHEQGKWRGQRYNHILPQDLWFLNIWEGVCFEAVKYFGRLRIKWHDQKHNLLSSQIACINLLFPLREYPELLKPWLSSRLEDVETVTDLDFEYIGPDDAQDPSGYRNYLNEPGSRGQNRTSADVAVTWRNSEGRKNLLLLEFKFTEPNFGECSRQKNPDRRRCLSSKEIARSPQTQCYRTEVGRPYWDIILSSDSPLQQGLLTTEAFCPFRYDFYQLMRNQLLAHCIQTDPKEHYNKVDFGVVYHADNEKLMNMSRSFGNEKDPLKAWQKLLRYPDTFHVFTIQELLESISSNLPSSLLDWRRYLEEKYLL
jgi:hypothetical protein